MRKAEHDRLPGVPTPEDLAAQAAAVAAVRVARIDRDRVTGEATRQLHRAIITAYRAGATVRDIAAAAELSRQWVHRIVRDR